MNQLQVINTNGYRSDWSREKIITSLLEETGLASNFHKVDPIDRETAEKLAIQAEVMINCLNLASVPGSLIREVVNVILLEEGYPEFAQFMRRVGMPVCDAYAIDTGLRGGGDNANLQANAETAHKRKADKLAKEQALAMLPAHLRDLHLNADLHIHDLEYLTTRIFCIPGEELITTSSNGSIYHLPLSQFGEDFITIEGNSDGLKLFTPAAGSLKVLAHDKWRDVITISQRPLEGDLIEIKLMDGRIFKTTPEHRICVVDDNRYVFIKCEDLKVGQEVHCHDPEYCSPHRVRSDLSHEYCRFLGAFIANGHYNALKNGGRNIFISDPDDSLEDIVKEYGQSAGYRFSSSNKSSSGVQQYINSNPDLFSRLKAEGIGSGAYYKCLPNDFFNWPIEMQRSLMGGLFAGDGCVYYDEKASGLCVDYKSVSYTLIQQICCYLRNNHIDFTVHKHPPNKTIIRGGECNGRYPCYRVHLHTGSYRSNPEVIPLINKQQISDYSKFITQVKSINRSKKIRKSVIKSIEVIPYSGYVYDLSVDGERELEHTFTISQNVVVSNCQDYDLRYFFYYGLMADGNGLSSSTARAAKSPEVAILHAAKVLASGQCGCAGGQGFFNFLVFMAPYFHGCEYTKIKQCLQMFIYEMTQMYAARGGQVVFSSVQLTPGIPKMWKQIPAVYLGKKWDGIQTTEKRVYGDFEIECRLAFKAFMEIIYEGDAKGKVFNYPKPEVSIEPTFIKELDTPYQYKAGDYMIGPIPTYRELYELAFSVAAKNGSPYFDNQLPKYRNADKGVTCVQCCSYIFSSDPETDLNFKNKYEFNDGHHMSMGSDQVMTLNFPRIAYRSGGDYKKFIKECHQLLDRCVEVFLIKREWMRNIRSLGRMPFLQQTPVDPNDPTKRGPELVDFDALVYTIGLIGMNEVVQALIGKQFHEDEDAIKLGMKISLDLKKYCEMLSKTHGIQIAFARTPAETTGQRFAVADLKSPEYRDQAMEVVKGNIEYAKEHLDQKDLPVYYTNGTMLPPACQVPLAEKIRIESLFFPIISGGNIVHIWLNEAQPDTKGLMDMFMSICKNTNLGYASFTKDITICKNEYRWYSP